jgi:hypothetical protein
VNDDNHLRNRSQWLAYENDEHGHRESVRVREGKRWYGVEKLIAPPSKRLTSCCESFGF